MHPQSSAFHPLGQIDLALPIQQAHRPHFPQVHPYRIVAQRGFYGVILQMRIKLVAFPEIVVREAAGESSATAAISLLPDL